MHLFILTPKQRYHASLRSSQDNSPSYASYAVHIALPMAGMTSSLTKPDCAESLICTSINHLSTQHASQDSRIAHSSPISNVSRAPGESFITTSVTYSSSRVTYNHDCAFGFRSFRHSMPTMPPTKFSRLHMHCAAAASRIEGGRCNAFFTSFREPYPKPRSLTQPQASTPPARFLGNSDGTF